MNDTRTTERLRLSVLRDPPERGWTPDDDRLRRWIATAVDAAAQPMAAKFSVSLLITDDATIGELNRRWRDRNKPTNVLAFPAWEPAQLAAAADDAGDAPLPLGDIVVSAERARAEARDMAREEEMHWAHLIVHASLHLIGYDHVRPDQARVMEPLEIEILNGRLGFAPPYETA